MENMLFLTGFPGFIASRLLLRLAQEDWNFSLLVQREFLRTANERIREISYRSNRPVQDFRIIEGDLAAPELGIAQTELTTLRAETKIIFHLAALYDLAVAREPAMRVNVEGTRNVNRFALSLTNLRHYHYVSTCYVAGKRKGLVRENELQHGAGFRNCYEETKYLAELEVEGLKADLPITIHRPAVVCGDSKTGETAKYDGIYYLIRYLLKAPRILSRFNIGNDDVTLNLVPVDFVVESMAALTHEREALGKTLHLADPAPLTTRSLFDSISRCLAGKGSLLTVPPALVQFTLMLPPSPSITGLPHNAVPYFFLKQTYDSSDAQRLLHAQNLACPSFETYVEKIVEFAKLHPSI